MKLCILDIIDRKVENCGKVEKITGHGGKSNIDVGNTLLLLIKNNIICIEKLGFHNRYRIYIRIAY